MNVLQSPITKLVILIVVIAAAVGLQLGFDFKQGVDIDNSSVVEVTFDHDETAQTVREAALQAHEPVTIEQSGTTKFRLYYQNRSPEELTEVQNRLEESLGGVIDSKTFLSTPGIQFALVGSRITTDTVALGLGVIVMFILFVFYKKNFLLIDVVSFLLAQLIFMFVWFAAVLTLVAALASALGYGIGMWFLLSAGAGYLVFATMGVFLLYRFIVMLIDSKPGDIAPMWTDFIANNRKVGLFVAAVASLPFLIFVILPAPQLFAVLTIVIATIASYLAHFYLFDGFLELLSTLVRKLKLNKRISRRW